MQCDLSGFVGLASEMKETWDGKWVLAKFWEPRHPQDYVRGRAEDQSVPVSRPRSDVVTYAERFPNGFTKDDL